MAFQQWRKKALHTGRKLTICWVCTQQTITTMSDEEPDFDDKKLTSFVDGLVLYERKNAKGDEDDRKVMAEIQSWFKKSASVVCRIIGPARLMARVVSRGMEEEVHFLDILMPLTKACVDEWDGRGIPDRPLSTRTQLVKAMEKWHKALEKKN